jgi:hypothetical protein
MDLSGLYSPLVVTSCALLASIFAPQHDMSIRTGAGSFFDLESPLC